MSGAIGTTTKVTSKSDVYSAILRTSARVAPSTMQTGRPTRHVRNDSREFIVWDGEGVTPPGEVHQRYVLFGAVTKVGGEWAHTVETSSRLRTSQCLRLIMDMGRKHKYGIHVGFAFGYDVEMILADLNRNTMQRLKNVGSVFFDHYRIEYRPRKWFQVTDRERRETVRIWDVWGFFQASLVSALETNLGLEDPDVALVIAGKSQRSHFALADVAGSIMEYWLVENKLVHRLMHKLRDNLYSAGLKINQWHGPGAIASYAFSRHKTESAMADSPIAVRRAAQFAYAGGRFEQFKVGMVNQPIYAYDINSAYPNAIRLLPNLARGHWKHVDKPNAVARFGVYRVEYRSRTIFPTAPKPLFFRDAKGAIHYPAMIGEGWYWSPEVQTLFDDDKGDFLISEGWVFVEDDPTDRPFAWVEDIFELRAAWKADKNDAQIALKLLLNSLYGKMAQRVGGRINDDGTYRIPRYHQLEWAGWVTSYTRAMIFRAMQQAGDDLLGVETDGIFSAKPLDLDCGPRLGQWELTKYSSMIYLQSGFYFKQTDAGKWEAKSRGFDKNSVTVDNVISALAEWKPWEGTVIISGVTTRFTSMGQWLLSPTGDEKRNSWTTETREMRLGSDGKRIHRHKLCRQCAQRASPAETAHTLTTSFIIGDGRSKAHYLPWVGLDDMTPFTTDSINESSDRQSAEIQPGEMSWIV